MANEFARKRMPEPSMPNDPTQHPTARRGTKHTHTQGWCTNEADSRHATTACVAFPPRTCRFPLWPHAPSFPWGGRGCPHPNLAAPSWKQQGAQKSAPREHAHDHPRCNAFKASPTIPMDGPGCGYTDMRCLSEGRAGPGIQAASPWTRLKTEICLTSRSGPIP